MFLFHTQTLPAPVKRRLKALKKIQFEATKIEAKFYEEIHALEVKYHQMYTPLYEKRATITKGQCYYVTFLLKMRLVWDIVLDFGQKSCFRLLFNVMNAFMAPPATSYEGTAVIRKTNS